MSADRVYHRIIPAVALVLAVVVVILTVALVRSSNGAEDPDSANSVAYSDGDKKEVNAVQDAVRKLFVKYNQGDWKFVEDNTCGDVRLRFLEGRKDGIVSDAEDKVVKSTKVSDFSYALVTNNSARIFARLTFAAEDDPGGENSENIGFFALLKDSGVWRVCTAREASSVVQ